MLAQSHLRMILGLKSAKKCHFSAKAMMSRTIHPSNLFVVAREKQQKRKKKRSCVPARFLLLGASQDVCGRLEEWVHIRVKLLKNVATYFCVLFNLSKRS